jgi:hypothetical protein
MNFFFPSIHYFFATSSKMPTWHPIYYLMKMKTPLGLAFPFLQQCLHSCPSLLIRISAISLFLPLGIKGDYLYTLVNKGERLNIIIQRSVFFLGFATKWLGWHRPHTWQRMSGSGKPDKQCR